MNIYLVQHALCVVDPDARAEAIALTWLSYRSIQVDSSFLDISIIET
jgi:hypothetical protein